MVKRLKNIYILISSHSQLKPLLCCSSDTGASLCCFPSCPNGHAVEEALNKFSCSFSYVNQLLDLHLSTL